MTRDEVLAWVDAYVRLWRTPGTDRLAELFAEDATYLMGPWDSPIQGLPAIAENWEAERVGSDEVFTMTSEVVAVEGDVAVVRAQVEYAATGNRWRDLWILHFAADGRCAAFEEWPFAPAQRDGH